MADWRNKSDPVARIVRRVFSFANDHTDYDLGVDGQEPFSVIQYLHDKSTVHTATGAVMGARICTRGAWLRCSCTVASRSLEGRPHSPRPVFTSSRNKAKLFFSYRSENGTMDTELTEHSGCPVVTGTKWVVTQWLRSGVNRQESWTRFDPTGSRL